MIYSQYSQPHLLERLQKPGQPETESSRLEDIILKEHAFFITVSDNIG